MPKTSETSSFLPPINPSLSRKASRSSFYRARVPELKRASLGLELSVGDLVTGDTKVQSCDLDSVCLERSPIGKQLSLPSSLRALALPSLVGISSAAAYGYSGKIDSTCLDESAALLLRRKRHSYPRSRSLGNTTDLEITTVLDQTIFSPKP